MWVGFWKLMGVFFSVLNWLRECDNGEGGARRWSLGSWEGTGCNAHGEGFPLDGESTSHWAPARALVLKMSSVSLTF